MRFLTKTLLTIYFVFFSFYSIANEDDIYEYPNDNVELGQGWDSRKGEKKNALCVATNGENEDFKFQSVRSGAKKYKSKNEYSKLLQLNVSAKAKSILGSGSLSVSANELSSTKIEDNIDNYMATVDVKNNEKSLKAPVTLKTEYEDLRKKNPLDFFSTCGDTYVSSIKTGGMLIVDFKYQNSNFEERRRLELGLEGSTVNLKFDGKKLSEESSRKYVESIETKYFQDGGFGLPIPGSIADAENALSTFPAAVGGKHQRPYKLKVLKYDLNPSDQVSEQEIKLKLLTDNYFEITDLFNFYNKAYLFSELYIPFTSNTNFISATRDKLNEIRSLYYNAINDCYHKSKCEINQNGAEPPDLNLESKYFLRAMLPIQNVDLRNFEQSDIVNNELVSLFEQLSKQSCYVSSTPTPGGISIPNMGGATSPSLPPCNNPEFLRLRNEIQKKQLEQNQLNNGYLNDVINSSYNKWVKYDVLEECMYIDSPHKQCPSSKALESIRNASKNQIITMYHYPLCEHLEKNYSDISEEISNIEENITLLDSANSSEKDKLNIQKTDLQIQQYYLTFQASNLSVRAHPGCGFTINETGDLVVRESVIGKTALYSLN